MDKVTRLQISVLLCPIIQGYLVNNIQLCLMGKDTRSQGHTFLCCRDLQLMGTRALICHTYVISSFDGQGYKVTVFHAVVTKNLRVHGHQYVNSFWQYAPIV